MTKLFSKLKLVKLFYISPQQDQETITITSQPRYAQKTITIIDQNTSQINSVIPNSPDNYHNHKPNSGYNQETIILINQETIIIIDQPE